MRTDAPMRDEIERALRWDPRVGDAAIGVTVERGVATLRGAVGSYARRRAAEEIAHRLAGARDVANEITVQLPLEHLRPDDEVARAVRHALEWDVTVPHERIFCAVSQGWVTLDGAVDQADERAAAEEAILKLVGVRGITNNITIEGQRVAAHEVRAQITAALERRAQDAARRLEVTIDDGQVTVGGQVRCWAEKEAVLLATRTTPGMRQVVDRLLIVPEMAMPHP
jgi:osmotically-inducible protein OsmY